MANSFDIFNASREFFADGAESCRFLRSSCERLGVLNLSYWFLGTSSEIPDRMSWFSTYDQGYTELYQREFTPLRDKVFQIGFRDLLPVDWENVRRVDETVASIHELAEGFGVGRHGISFPIREPGVGDAMFSVNFGCEDRHWAEVRANRVSEVHLFAHYFHLRMKSVIATQAVTAEFDLSPREREVLLWASEGKTAWETAQLLRVSESAVNLYTSNALNKLRAKTKTQAVAIAVRNGVLN